jgi:rSAM/selenodomain-associated transferase 1
MSDALLVFAKVPRPGAVKTRLTPVLTPGEAARLYRAFLKDALDQYRSLDVDVRLHLAGMNGTPELPFVPEDVPVFAQEGDGLGPRMQTAFRDAFSSGFERVCVIGTDHPTLPSGFVRQGFKSLDAPSAITIGPSADGGFYLLGMRSFHPVLFDGMTYSHSRVFSDTLARVSRTDAHLTVLPRWYDVDTPETLRRLLDDLDAEPNAAPHTRAVIDDLDLAKIGT